MAAFWHLQYLLKMIFQTEMFFYWGLLWSQVSEAVAHVRPHFSSTRPLRK